MFYSLWCGLPRCMFHSFVKECEFCCCWGDCFINVDSILLVDGVLNYFYILADFPCSCSTGRRKRDVEVSVIVVYFSVSSFNLAGFSQVFCSFVVCMPRIAMSYWWFDSFYHFVMSLSVSAKSLLLNLSDINTRFLLLLLFLKTLFIYFWLCWVFTAEQAFPCGGEGRTVQCSVCASHWLQSAGCRRERSVAAVPRIRSTGPVVVVQGHVRSSRTRNWTCVFCLGRRILYLWATREAALPLSFE